MHQSDRFEMPEFIALKLKYVMIDLIPVIG